MVSSGRDPAPDARRVWTAGEPRRAVAEDWTGDPRREPQQPLRHAGALRAVLTTRGSNPPRGGGARVFPRWVAHRVDRSPDLRRHHRRSRLDAGEILILYPEGTRGMPGVMSELKAGVAYLARRYPKVPVVPVTLSGVERILPKGAVVPLPLTVAA